MSATSPAIGWIPDLRPVERCVPLHVGDVLLIYTDGISESLDHTGEDLGVLGLARLAARHAGAPPEEIVRLLLHEVDELSACAPAADDRTLDVAKVCGS